MEKLNDWLSLVGNFGVIAGLVLLAYELQQNSDLMRAQTRHELAVSMMEVGGAPAEHTHLAEAMMKSPEDLTPAERVILRSHYTRIFHHWADAFYQYRMGLYDKSEFLAQTKIWERVLASRSGRDGWCFYRDLAESGLVAVVDSILEPAGSACPDRLERVLPQNS